MAKWLGPGVLTAKGKDYGYGKDIPKDLLSKKRLKTFIDKGYIGDLPEAIDLEALRSEHITALEKEVKTLKKENSTLKGSNTKLKTENADLKTVITEIDKGGGK